MRTFKEFISEKKKQKESILSWDSSFGEVRDYNQAPQVSEDFSIKHKHCDVIKAWADGFDEKMEYSVKPVNYEPDWSNSKTGILEIWKNPMYSMQDRLIMADGAISFLQEVTRNQRNQIFELVEKIEKNKEIVTKN